MDSSRLLRGQPGPEAVMCGQEGDGRGYEDHDHHGDEQGVAGLAPLQKTHLPDLALWVKRNVRLSNSGLESRSDPRPPRRRWRGSRWRW